MDKTKYRPVIALAVFLDRKDMRDTGRRAYAFLLLNEHGSVAARPFVSRDIREVVDYVVTHRVKAGLGRVSFEPPDGVDAQDSKNPRRYQAIGLPDIYFASTMLGQS